MFFVLSKTVSYLAMPLTIVFVLLGLGLFLKNTRWKKRCLYAGVVLLLFFSNGFIANELFRAWELPARSFETLKPYRMAVVLTGVVSQGRDPDDRTYFRKGADRVTHTVQLYKLGLVEKILISGGDGRLLGPARPEAELLREAMVVMGVPEEVILLEENSDNTHENAVFTAQMLKKLGVAPDECILVTSAFHMRRAIACFRKQGIEMEVFPTDFYSEPRLHPDAYIIPKPEALILWQKLFKEWIGLVAYKVAGYI